MPWFKKSSGEEPSEAPAAAPNEAPVDPVDEVDPVLEPLTPAEVDWVRTSIAELADQEVRLGDIDDLGRHYDEMLNAWVRLNEARRPDPNVIINQIGLAFGQYVADQARLDWAVATDAHGTEIALHQARGNVLIYPTNLVAKRWAAQELNVIPAMARDLIATVEAMP